MKLLFVLSLLFINNLSSPCDTPKQKDTNKPGRVVKPAKKSKATPPLIPSIIIFDIS
ncbi:MAG TPA: hypothetical protein VM871_02500 [Flavisolibacter sp.]|jgi:hypothetical protein|nr:hypothetical protein [Flavisolibacter sp.]